ncbi:MAG: hypothetical protein N4A48_07305 [Tepidibacter sp.]|uniref:hypothetical protein n=1 Tax=Tepidibacter sp. TaxID=2529387 RepID=UPI0025F6D39D|nr:hypothetical protein [Tepidibacter sp.]MCT4508556.1 hypothetical protein [Tepidibacter sp.]
MKKSIYVVIFMIVLISSINYSGMSDKNIIKYKNIIYHRSINDVIKYNKEVEKIINLKENNKNYIYRWIESTYEIKNNKNKKVEHKINMKVLAKIYIKDSVANIIDVYDTTLKYEIYSNKKYKCNSTISFTKVSDNRDAVVFILGAYLKKDDYSKRITLNRTEYI